MFHLYLLVMEPGVISAGNAEPTFPGTKEDSTKLWSVGYSNKGPCKVDLQEDSGGCLRSCRVTQQWGVWNRRRVRHKKNGQAKSSESLFNKARPKPPALLPAGEVPPLLSAVSHLPPAGKSKGEGDLPTVQGFAGERTVLESFHGAW